MKKLMVMVAALALVATSAMTAAAADWNFFGSARVSTFIEDTEVIGGTGAADTKTFAEGLQGNARIGANVKVSDELTGAFEYGASSGTANIRKLYGEWNFGGGKFLVGQTYTPLNWFYSNQVFDGDADLLPYGGIYSGRHGMLQLSFGGFKIAAISPKEEAIGAYTMTEVDFPTIEASYTLKMDNMTFKLGAGYNSFEISDGTTSLDVDSYVVALGAALNFGAFYLNGNIYTGDNVGYIMAIDVDADRGWDDGKAAVSGGTVLDNECFGAIIVAGFKINDMFTVEAGYGYAETELDTATTEDEVASYYLNATVTLAPGVFFVPEVGMIDGEEDGDAEVTYYGVKWQINF